MQSHGQKVLRALEQFAGKNQDEIGSIPHLAAESMKSMILPVGTHRMNKMYK